jgi:hypothetical protein
LQLVTMNSDDSNGIKRLLKFIFILLEITSDTDPNRAYEPPN